MHGHVREEGLDEGEEKEEEVDTEETSTPFPGGPYVAELLSSYKRYVAASIWFRIERRVLRCNNYTSKLKEWSLPRKECSETWNAMVKASTLGQLRRISYMEVNKVLVTAFVKRWHLEINSFHMPFGEMTITLDDVFCITGLLIIGETVISKRSVTPADVSRMLGVSVADAKEAMQGIRESTVKLEWLQQRCSGYISYEDPTTCAYSVRAYLLYLLGCIVFVDKSGTRVSTSYLELLDNLDSVRNYAWGAATLTFLYRELGKASRASVK